MSRIDNTVQEPLPDSIRCKSLTVRGGSATFTGKIIGMPAINKIKSITVATAADASHTLSEADAGLVFINVALDTSSVIKLPATSTPRIGLYYKVAFLATMAGTATIGLPATPAANYLLGPLACIKSGQNTAGGAANHTVVLANGTSTKTLALDENAPGKGGAIGTVIEFYYVSTTQVVVDGRIMVNHAGAPTGGALLSNTGWS